MSSLMISASCPLSMSFSKPKDISSIHNQYMLSRVGRFRPKFSQLTPLSGLTLAFPPHPMDCVRRGWCRVPEWTGILPRLDCSGGAEKAWFVCTVVERPDLVGVAQSLYLCNISNMAFTVYIRDLLALVTFFFVLKFEANKFLLLRIHLFIVQPHL